jgi:two-component system response regulator NreC
MGKIRVLSVDDGSVVRHGVSLILQQVDDLEVIEEAGDEPGLFESIQDLSPDVVLMDIEIAAQSDFDIVRRVNGTATAVSTLVFNFYDDEELVFRALEAGVNGLLLQSASVEDLVHAIRAVSGGNCFFSAGTPLRWTASTKRLTNGHEVDAYGRLSGREKEFLPLLAEGRTIYEIAQDFDLSPNTILTYRQRTMKKLGVHSQCELLKYALRKGLIQLEPMTTTRQ